jgi:hypothetical protein
MPTPLDYPVFIFSPSGQFPPFGVRNLGGEVRGRADVTAGLDHTPFLPPGHGDWGILRDVLGEDIPMALLPNNWPEENIDPPSSDSLHLWAYQTAGREWT